MFLLGTVHGQRCVQTSCVWCDVAGPVAVMCFCCVQEEILKAVTKLRWLSVAGARRKLNKKERGKIVHRLETRYSYVQLYCWVRSQNCAKRLLASSCVPVRMEQLGSYWTYFLEIWHLSISLFFENMQRKLYSITI